MQREVQSLACDRFRADIAQAGRHPGAECPAKAIRIADGNPRALHAATVAALEQLGLLDDPSGTPLAAYDCPPIRNYRGIETGGVVPVFKLRSVRRAQSAEHDLPAR